MQATAILETIRVRLGDDCATTEYLTGEKAGQFYCGLTEAYNSDEVRAYVESQGYTFTHSDAGDWMYFRRGGSPVEQFEANVEAGIPAAVVIRPIAVHHFSSTAEAYESCQFLGKSIVKAGDVLVIASEGVVGVADTWPVAITAECGELHQLGDYPEADAWRAKMADSVKAAEAEAAKLAGAAPQPFTVFHINHGAITVDHVMAHSADAALEAAKAQDLCDPVIFAGHISALASE